MFFTVLYVPVAAAIALGGPAPTMDILAKEGPDFFSSSRTPPAWALLPS